jgi:hypothetical protein
MEQHDALWFVHVGHQFLTTSDSSDVIRPELGWQSRVGYDGQYYFGVAADPTHARDYMPGRAGIVYSRVLYPAVARTLSLGSIRALPYVLLIVNVLAAVVGTLAVALWLRRHGAPAWPAALFGLYPGLIFTVLRDLTEPLAFALTALAVLAYDGQRTRRLVLSATLFALAGLTRETVLPFALACAATLAVTDVRGAGWRQPQAWRRAFLFAAAAIAPLLVWRGLVTAYVHEPTQETGGRGWAVPFYGILSYWHWDPQHRLIVLTIVVPALAAAGGALVLLWRRLAPVAGMLLLVNVLLYVVFLPRSVEVDYGAAARAAVGVVLAALYCLPAWWGRAEPGRERAIVLRRSLVVGGSFAWSLAWYLLVASHYGLPGWLLITT